MNGYRALLAPLLRAQYRDPVTLVMAIVLPVGLLVFFVYQFGSADAPADTAVMVPSIMAFGTCFVGAYNAAMDLAAWRENGMLQILRNAPVSARAVVLAALTSASVMALVQFVALSVVAASPLVGVRLATTWPLAFFPLLLGSVVFFLIGWIVAMLVKTMQAVGTIIGLATMAIAYFAGAIFPSAMLPGWVQRVEPFIPMRHVIDAVAPLLIGAGATTHTALASVLFLLLLGLVLVAFVDRGLRWE